MASEPTFPTAANLISNTPGCPVTPDTDTASAPNSALRTAAIAAASFVALPEMVTEEEVSVVPGLRGSSMLSVSDCDTAPEVYEMRCHSFVVSVPLTTVLTLATPLRETTARFLPIDRIVPNAAWIAAASAAASMTALSTPSVSM